MSGYIHVWAFDPGLVTGWCHISVHGDGETGLFNSGQASHLEIGNLLYDNAALRSVVERKTFEVIFVVERFIMNAKVTQSPWSLETIGLIRYFGERYHLPLEMQGPSQVKGLITDNVVKKAGLYLPGQPHAVDAIRHALFYLTVKKKLLQDCLT